MAKIDWDTVSSFIEGIGATDKTITFPKVQDYVKVTNKGNVNVIYTIGTQTGTLAPNDNVEVRENITSFTVRASSGTSEVYVRASEAGTEKEDIPSGIPADIAVQLEDVKSSLAQSAKHQTQWINVKQAPYNAKGDGSDDTSAFVSALNDLSSGGVLYVPYGWKWGITSITIPKNVTLKMDKGVFDYSLANFTKDTNDKAILDNAFVKLDDSPVMITCYGNLENVRINGNRKQGLVVDMRGGFDGLSITRAAQALKISKGSYEFKNLWVTGNFGDGLTWGQDVADTRLHYFNVWSNLGHGCVFTGGNGTINFTSGKFEWNYKNNIEVLGYTNEISFNDCIIDAANWYNIHLGINGYMLDSKFTHCNIIGSRRDTANVYGETTPLPTYPNQTLSQFYLESQHFDVKFSNCFFRKLNALHEAGVTEQITHMFGGNSITVTYPISLDNCNCTDFPFANWKIGLNNYIGDMIATRFSDSSSFMGGVVKGEIVFPVTTGANITGYTGKKDGTAIFNQDDQSLNIQMYGNNYKILTNKAGKWVGVPASATATGVAGDFSADANYFYICYATNLWRRVAIVSW